MWWSFKSEHLHSSLPLQWIMILAQLFCHNFWNIFLLLSYFLIKKNNIEVERGREKLRIQWEYEREVSKKQVSFLMIKSKLFRNKKQVVASRYGTCEKMKWIKHCFQKTFQTTIYVWLNFLICQKSCSKSNRLPMVVYTGERYKNHRIFICSTCIKWNHILKQWINFPTNIICLKDILVNLLHLPRTHKRMMD